MGRLEVNLIFRVHEDSDGLDLAVRGLLRQATDALHRAYAPYSGFNVGAAVLLDNGEVVSANNQENVAYPSGLCAERVALFAAHSRYPANKITALAITADTKRFPLKDPVYPCGACRQVMVELENKQNSPIRVLMGGPEGKLVEASSAADLLPLQFKAELKKKDQ